MIETKMNKKEKRDLSDVKDHLIESFVETKKRIFRKKRHDS